MSPHRDSPIEVVVRAAGCDPQQSEAFGGGLAGGNLREACTFAVRARDKWGHPCDPVSKPAPRWRASTAQEAAWPGVAASYGAGESLLGAMLAEAWRTLGFDIPSTCL